MAVIGAEIGGYISNAVSGEVSREPWPKRPKIVDLARKRAERDFGRIETLDGELHASSASPHSEQNPGAPCDRYRRPQDRHVVR